MPEPQPTTRLLILVVKEEPLVRVTLVDVLEDAGFRVIKAVYVDEALRVLKAVPEIHATQFWCS